MAVGVRRDSSSSLSSAPSEEAVPAVKAPARKPTNRKRAAEDLNENVTSVPAKRRKQEVTIPEPANSASKSPQTRRAPFKAVVEAEEEVASSTSKTTVKGSNKPRRTAKVEVKVEDTVEVERAEEATTASSTSKSTPKKSRRSIKKEKADEEGKAEVKDESDGQTEELEVKPRPKARRKAKASKVADQDGVDGEGDTAEDAKPKRKRKTKEEKEAEMQPLAARTANHLHYIGAHVSAAGGVHNAVQNAVHIGGNAFALFLKSQRKWANPDLKPEHTTLFRSACDNHKYLADSHVLPHGSYLVNLAHSDSARKKQAYDSFLDDLRRCEQLGIKLYNFHPGNTAGEPRNQAIANLANHINAALSATSSVTLLLETMAASATSNTLGGAGFADLRDVIALVADEHKHRVGICLDTCHVFAAGHDLRSPEAFAATMQLFDDVVGAQYIKALHLNDSKAPLGSHRDLHANIGTGFLGLRAFHNVLNFKPFQGLPLVLETPIEVAAPSSAADSINVESRAENDADNDDAAASPDIEKSKKKKPKKPPTAAKTTEDKSIWAREIKLLESLVGMDVDSSEFQQLEAELSEKGRASRDKHMEQFERKQAEAVKKGEREAKRKGKKGNQAEQEVEEALEEEESADGGNESEEEEREGRF